jgi:hypothetical protein
MKPLDALKGFIAGFAATLLFHQPVLWLLFEAGLATRRPYSLSPTQPLGVPSAISLAFWGGVWGIVLLLAVRPVLKRPAFWIAALIFGAVAPTLVAWLVVAPLKGQPLGGGWKPAGMLTGLAINGAWGLGTAVFLRLFRAR